MMVYAYVHGITEFGENEPSVQKSVFKRLRVEHCTVLQKSSGKTFQNGVQSSDRRSIAIVQVIKTF